MIKDWHIYKKRKNKGIIFQAVHKRNWIILDILKHDNTDYIFSVEVDQGESLKQETFRTKLQALKYAKSYMEKH
jgi:hypothetical protein